MSRLTKTVGAVVLSLGFGILLSGTAYAGSAVVGSVAGSMNATIGGQELVPNATIFSGDSLQVRDGVAVVAVGRGSRLVFGRESAVSFLREADSVTVVLDRGTVSLFCPEAGAGVRVKAGEVTIVPAKGFKTLGEVAMANGAVLVTTKEGLLRVEGEGGAVEVAKGKTIAVTRKAERAPQGSGGGGGHGWSTLQILSLGAGITSAVLGAWAIHSGNEAHRNANDAIAAAEAARQAALAAQAAAQAALDASYAAGCALNRVASQLGILTSPYTPPAGYPSC